MEMEMTSRELELSFCPFELKAGEDGRTLMWWAEENTWIASFASRTIAVEFVVGSDFPRHPGWDRSDVDVDVKAALYAYHERTGAFPQFEFDETHDVLDLYQPLGLAGAFVSRLIYYEVSAINPEPDPADADAWNAMVSRLLIEKGLDPEAAAAAAPAAMQLMFQSIAAVVALEDRTRGIGGPAPEPMTSDRTIN